MAAALEDISTEAALAFIATLPRDQAEIVILRVVVGLDAVQVARIVDKSPGAVRIAAHRGLRTLTSRLAGSDVAAPGTTAPGSGIAASGRGGVTQ
jgi:RNA polymerase sigma-70 factor (ECF subfamily)